MGETREQYYGVKGEPFGRDHLVLARSASTLCGKTIGANWLMARGIFTAKSFIGSPGACEACSDAVRPPARDGETLSDEPTKSRRRSRHLPAIGTVSEHACYDCGQGRPVVVREKRTARWGHDPEVEITDEWYRCPKCGEGFYTFEQAQAHERDLWLATIAALRAQLAEARADTERVEFVEELIVDARGRAFDLVNASSNGLVRIETWGSDSFRSVIDAERAARAASGEDASRE